MIVDKYVNIISNKYKQITYVFFNKYSMKFENFMRENCENHIFVEFERKAKNYTGVNHNIACYVSIFETQFLCLLSVLTTLN